MKKALIFGGGAVVVIVIAIIVGFVFFAGDAIKAAVEEMGPKLTKSEVKLAKVDLSLTTGKAALSGLKIGNPSGFNSSHAFKLENIAVKIDTGSIGKNPIVINEILISAPDVIAEFKNFEFNPLKTNESIQKSLKTSNFIAIQNNVDAYIKQATGGAGGGESGGKDAKSGEEPKLIIEKFRMTGVKVRAISQGGLKLDTSLPPFSISIDNIGKKENGLPPAEIAAVLIPKVQDAVIKAITGDLSNVAGELFSKMGGAVNDVTKVLGSGASGAGGAVKGAAEGATSGIKKLFGN